MALTAEQKKNLDTLDFDSLDASSLNEAFELLEKQAEKTPVEDGLGTHNPEFLEEEVIPQEVKTTEEEVSAPKVKEEPPKPSKPTVKSERDRLAELKEAKFKADSEANRWKQQYEQLQRRMNDQAHIKAQQIEDVDPWDTDFQRKNYQTIKTMEQELQFVREERQRLEAERAREDIFRQAEDLAKEFNVPVDIRKADQEFKSLGASLNRAPTVEEFAKELGNKAQAEAYFDLLMAFQRKLEMNYPTARAAFRDMDLDKKWSAKQTPEWMLKQSEAAGHKQTTKAAANRGKVMPSSYSGKSSELTHEWAMNWMDKKGHRMDSWTKEDHEVFQKIQQRFLNL